MYAFADQCTGLAELVPELYGVLGRNGDALRDITHAYRVRATDTGYTEAFALRSGALDALTAADAVDVTVLGTEANLLAVFQRKLNPVKALLLGKIKVDGNKAALLKLAAFL